MWAFLLSLAVAVEPSPRQALSVDAAGHLSAENLRAEPAALAQLGSSWCEGISFDNFQKVGCGLCASSCNKHTLATLSAASNYSDTGSKAVGTQTQCQQFCAANNCVSFSFEWDATAGTGTCTLHNEMPYGAVCGSDTTDYHGCHVHPEDEHSAANIASCPNAACFVNDAQFSSNSRMVKLGTGSCRRETAMLLLGTPLQEPYSTAGTVEEDFKSRCEAQCKDDIACRSYNLGTTCKYGSGNTCQNIHRFCQLFSVTATFSSTDSNFMIADPCSMYSSAGQAMDQNECGVHEVDCYVRTVRTAPVMLMRGEGVCQTSGRDEATVLSTLSYSSAGGCQAECADDADCIGGTSAVGLDGAVSFCKLYKKSDSQLADSAITQSDPNLLQKSCATDVCTDTACSCQATPLAGWCSTCSDPSCCTPCHECLETFSSECFAKNVV